MQGRAFRKEEDQPNANYVAVLSNGAWQRLFGGDKSAIGRKIELNREFYEVIGVMPPEFAVPANADLWFPSGFGPEDYGPKNRFNESFTVLARLQPGVTAAQASAGMEVLAQQALDPQSRDFARTSQWSMFAITYSQFVGGPMRNAAWVLFGAVGFVLLIACSNIAGLLLARTSAKQREVSIRAALGAGSWQLMRQALAESFLLAGAGAAIGLAVAFIGLKLLVLVAPPEAHAERIVRLDMWVLLFTVGAGLLSGLLFGVAPAWQVARMIVK